MSQIVAAVRAMYSGREVSLPVSGAVMVPVEGSAMGPGGLGVVAVGGLEVRGLGRGLWRVGFTGLTVLGSCWSRRVLGGSLE